MHPKLCHHLLLPVQNYRLRQLKGRNVGLIGAGAVLFGGYCYELAFKLIFKH